MVFRMRMCVHSPNEIENVRDDLTHLYCLLKRYVENVCIPLLVDFAEAKIWKIDESRGFLIQYSMSLGSKIVLESVSRYVHLQSLLGKMNIAFEMREEDFNRNATRTIFFLSNEDGNESCRNKDKIRTLFRYFLSYRYRFDCNAYRSISVPREYCGHVAIRVISRNNDVNVTWKCQPMETSERNSNLSGHGMKIRCVLLYICLIAMLVSFDLIR